MKSDMDGHAIGQGGYHVDFTTWKTEKLKFKTALLLSFVRAANADYQRLILVKEQYVNAEHRPGSRYATVDGQIISWAFVQSVLQFLKNYRGRHDADIRTLRQYEAELSDRGVDTSALVAFLDGQS